MEPIDAAYETFCRFVDQVVPTYWDTVRTEADTRMKLIDPIFTGVLGWPAQEIHLEDQAGMGRIDYRLTASGLNRLIVEAKKEGRDLGVSADYAGRSFKLNGSVFNTEAAREGIHQSIYYCAQKGAELACVTNGQQWIVFRGNRGADGTDTCDGKACVFGSLAAVKEKFKKFYDLLSFEAVTGYRYRAVFQEEEGQPIRSKAFRAPVRIRDSRQFLKASNLSADIDRIMLPFFQDLSGEGDAEARRACFVTTSESHTAETGIARISEELRDHVRAIETEDPAQFTEAIKRVKEMNRHELILLVGTKGAGKSTFMERLFADVLDRKIADDCVLIRIDLADCGCDASTIIKWLDDNFLRVAEDAIFPNGPPTYDELVGMYWWEYKLWREGHAKPLYESNPTQFKIDFGKHIAARRAANPNEYITHMIARIVKGLKKVPCLVFDNADHFDVAFQEEVFKYAHALYRKSICLVLVPITDTTSWQLARQGPMQSFFTESFYLPTPPTDIVLRKRIEYLETRINEQDPVKGKGYFTSRGIRLEIDNIKAFAACLQTVFINTGEVADWIGRLANQDIRRCLQLTREIVSSPHLKIDDLLEAYVTKSALLLSQDEVKLAIIRGKYDIYPASNNSFVQNLFAFVTDLDTTPLIALRVLRFLELVWEGSTASDSRYAPTESVVEYLKSMGVEPRATRTCLQTMLETGLCLSYDPTAKKLEDAPKLQLSPSGRQHLAWAQRDWVYLESMAEVTPLLALESYTAIKAAVQSGTAIGRREAVRVFINYLLDEDAHYCLVPKHEYYSSQDKLRKTLAQQARSLVSAAGVLHASRRYGRAMGYVTTWKSDRGFGFIRQNDDAPDAYVHISDVLNPDGDHLKVGSTVEYDTVPHPDRPKAIKVLVLSDATD